MNREELITKDNIVYEKSNILTNDPTSYCPGCGHGTVHKLIAQTIEEMGIQSDVIGVSPVGCAVLAYDFIDIDMHEAAHGRASACATAIKRLYPEKYVFSYQGDGDLAAIGTNETIHTCNRGENIVIIFINNGIYGMTGGQMAPTTLPNMVTSTSPQGRDTVDTGPPLKMCEMVKDLDGTCYVTRQAVHTANYVRKTKRAIKKAFEYSQQNIGLSFVEIVSNCNSGWKLAPVKANEWLDENMLKYFPLGDFKTPKK
jgi:2-oxoglutarate ferredoxin oxidoreductase subunit beta